MHRSEPPTSPFGIYVHVPFCKHRCLYCDFYSLVPSGYPQEYVQWILHEYQLAKPLILGNLASIYLGGGTPSILHHGDIANLLRTLLNDAPQNHPIEITMECNPDDITPAYLTAIRRAGINRISIGVQSLDTNILTLIERRHGANQAIQAIEWAKEARFDSISVDIIYGIPSLQDDTLRTTIQRLLDLRPEHLSAYHLTREPGTRYDYKCRKNQLAEVDEEVSERHYAITRQMLTHAGYEHYEISNYALPNHRATHNANYWKGVPYLGIGPSAHSYDGAVRWHNPSNYRAYWKSLQGNTLPRILETKNTPNQAITEWLLMRLRTCEGIDLQEGKAKFGESTMHTLILRARNWLEEGKLILAENHLRIPPEHFLLTDSIIVDLMP